MGAAQEVLSGKERRTTWTTQKRRAADAKRRTVDCRSGAAWRDLPERYGAWSTVYSRFARWQEDGLFEKILKELGEEADLQDMSLDSSCVKAHQASAGAKKGL
jgi:hypothetical protein